MNNDELGEVTKLVTQLLALNAEIEVEEAVTKEKKEQARRLSQEAIPMAMQELGYSSVDLTDGTSIALKKEIYCSFSDEKRPEGLKWLEDNKLDGIIKSKTEIYFEKGEEEKRRSIEASLHDLAVEYLNIRTVHPQTLKAFIKDRLAAGKDVPMEKFGAIEVTVSKVTLPKKERFSL